MEISNKTVLATVTEDEVEKFINLELTIEAVNEMQDNLLAQMKIAIKKKNEFWAEMQEKYQVDGALKFNRLTREITRRND